MSQYREPWKEAGHAFISRGGEDGGVFIYDSGDSDIAAVFSDEMKNYKSVPVEQDFLIARRIVACVNALAGLNPQGIPDLIDAVERIVGVLNAAKMQNGGEDSTNILSTLEGALRGCQP